MNKFLRDLAYGKSGEDIIYNMLINDNKTEDVIDVRNQNLFQQMDVDFIQLFKTGKPLLIEVKTDSKAHQTGNIAYECISNIKYNTIGCFAKTCSQIIYYYIENIDKIVILDVYRLREYINNNKYKYKYTNMGDNAMGYLIPISDILKNGLGKISNYQTDIKRGILC